MLVMKLYFVCLQKGNRMDRYTNAQFADMHLVWHTRPLTTLDDPQNGVVSVTSLQAANFLHGCTRNCPISDISSWTHRSSREEKGRQTKRRLCWFWYRTIPVPRIINKFSSLIRVLLFLRRHYRASKVVSTMHFYSISHSLDVLHLSRNDEAHFWLNGYVNKQNCRIWSEANPQVYVETPLHPEKLTVWCALWAGGIIGPYFFKNDECHNVTVNARATIDLLKDTFGDRLISRFGPVNWPPRSCDLTPLDYFLWDYVKSLVYADKPQTLDHLEDNIRRVIADIRPQMLENVIENWTSRLNYIRASRGSPMPEIIFKM
ncbi:transposable element Tc3 transposase [Trichonephila clavipes]|nr:transposable element Tc3 transposase [Trichonephila clavipes]